MTFPSESFREFVAGVVLGPGFRRGTFAGAIRGTPSGWVRVTVRPLALRGEPHLQFTYFDGRKDIAKNVPLSEVAPVLDAVLAAGHSGIHLETATEEIDLRTSKKGKVFVGRKAATREVEVQPHNRVKEVPLPEGHADRLLEVMGIATPEGRIKPTMRAKFTQINEFLKHLAHLLDSAGLKGLGRTLEILDCGCGSSYLTLAAHHYLNDVLAIPARLIGVDVNEEVIRKSVQRAERLDATNLNFTCGPIHDVDMNPDIVFALHACDTATDQALARAVTAEAKLILSVPCCHHHLNEQFRSLVTPASSRCGVAPAPGVAPASSRCGVAPASSRCGVAPAPGVAPASSRCGVAPASSRCGGTNPFTSESDAAGRRTGEDAGPTQLRPILRHGILRERAADLATDAFRALALRIMGYRTEVVEFTSPEHTARNLMIRAVRGAPAGEAAFLREYQDMKRFWNATPYIEAALGEPFLRMLNENGRE